jgi:hypothetical protein
MLTEYIGIGGAMVQLAEKDRVLFVAAKKAENREAKCKLPVGKFPIPLGWCEIVE